MITKIRINIRNKLVKIHRSRRRNVAIRTIRELIAKRTKRSAEDIKISNKAARYINLAVARRMEPIDIFLSEQDNKLIAKLEEEAKEAKGEEKKTEDKGDENKGGVVKSGNNKV
ncbi:MAG: hypothetical protein QXL16_01820 [Candidatus Micrarchaeaceae archaeon]